MLFLHYLERQVSVIKHGDASTNFCIHAWLEEYIHIFTERGYLVVIKKESEMDELHDNNSFPRFATHTLTHTNKHITYILLQVINKNPWVKRVRLFF